MNHETSYLQGRLTEIENQKRLKMAEIAELDKAANKIRAILKPAKLPVIEPCGMVNEEHYPSGC